jgi:GDPmannose 4,6-dehydratase
MERVLITGITGQVGSYLAEKFLAKGYEVHGLVRRTSLYTRDRIDHLTSNKNIYNKILFLHYGDLTDGSNISRLIEKTNPSYVVNLAAQSHVKISFDVPEYSAQVDAIGVLRLLDAIREICPSSKFLQASTSEMFGKVQEVPQKETTPFNPRSPYAAAKVFGYWITKNYREAYGLFASNIIMFNTESPRRGENFVTKKITTAVANISKGKQEKVLLGNLSAKRDWGYAPEYCDAIIKIITHKDPDDFVIASGENHSVEEFCKAAFEAAGIPLKFKGKGIERKGYDRDGIIRVEVDPKYFRLTEVETLLGDASKAKNILGWESTTKFKDIVQKMVHYDIERLHE